MKLQILSLVTGTLATLTLGVTSGVDHEQETKDTPAATAKAAAGDTPDGLRKLPGAGDVWLDTKRNAVVVDGQVCLREGLLEMFAVPKGRKSTSRLFR